MNLLRRMPEPGAGQLVASLEQLGVDHVFGLPGTQNLALFEALRKSRRLRTVVATSELAASFMACGYGRASARPGVLVTIPGPGFTCALTGLAEAMLDSVPLLYIVGAPSTSPGTRFQLQAIDQAAMAAPVCKAVFTIGHPGEIAPTIARAHALALSGEPGPVLVEIAEAAMGAPATPCGESVDGGSTARASPGRDPSAAAAEAPGARRATLDAVAGAIAAARRIVIYAGQGALGDPAALQRLAQMLGAVVATTTSGRGVIAEDHPQVLACDARSQRLVALLERADLILALGVKFSHNGAHGFRLQLARERLVHVDASRATLDGHYPARIAVAADVPDFVRELTTMLASAGPAPARRAPDWPEAALAAARDGDESVRNAAAEPAFAHARPANAAGFFSMLRDALPRDAIVTTDSGRHQMLARRHFQVLCAGGLLVPTGLQSMGFALPAAIGAQLARPARKVVALVGDGGMLMTGMELLIAKRERLALTVIVFVDGHYGLIRQQQIDRHGHAHGTGLHNPDFAQWSAALGVRHFQFDGARSLHAALSARDPALLEVAVDDSMAPGPRQLQAMARNMLDSAVPGLRQWSSRRSGGLD